MPKPARSSAAREPSRATRQVARFSLPIAVVFGLLAAASLVALVWNLGSGNGLYPVVLSAGQAVLFGGIAYSVGVELRKNVREWDAALQQRRGLESP